MEHLITKDGVYAIPEVGDPVLQYTQEEFNQLMNTAATHGSGTTTQDVSPSQEDTNMTANALDRLARTTGGLSRRIKEAVAKLPDDPVLAGIVNDYVDWYYNGGIARPGTPKWEVGTGIWSRVDALMGKVADPDPQVGNQPDLFDKEGTIPTTSPDSGASTVKEEPVIDEVTAQEEHSDEGTNTTYNDPAELGEAEVIINTKEVSNMGTQTGNTNLRTLIEINCYGELAEKVIDLNHRAPKDPEVQRLARRFWAHWQMDYSAAKNRQARGLHRCADRLRSAHPTISERVGSSANTMLEVIFTVMDRTSKVLGTIGEEAGRNAGTMIGSTIRGASSGIREVQIARMQMVVDNATDKAYNQLNTQFNEVKVAKYSRRVQGREVRRQVRAAVKAMAEDVAE